MSWQLVPDGGRQATAVDSRFLSTIYVTAVNPDIGHESGHRPDRLNESRSCAPSLFLPILLPLSSGVTAQSSNLRRRPNAFNLLFQLQLLEKSGLSQEQSIRNLVAGQWCQDPCCPLFASCARPRRASPSLRRRTASAPKSPRLQ